VVLRFDVKDTGIGIPPEKLQTVFHAFEQADTSTTRIYGGTGLGLTISSNIVRMMGGQISVESEVGQGSCFSFTARFRISDRPSVRQSMPGSERLKGSRILVVDDNAANRKILAEMLRGCEMAPTVIGDGFSALAAMEKACDEQQSFPFVLLDAHMPHMDGFTLAEQIKSNPRLAGVTLMMLSSAALPSDVERCQSLGIVIYLTKPIKKSELFEGLCRAACLGSSKDSNAAPTLEGSAVLENRAVPSAVGLTMRKLRILLAEDNVVNQRVVTGILEKRGHEVVVVSDGREAIRAVQCKPFDVILMDVQMPVMDGLEATTAIREFEQPLGRKTPIVALTARAMQGDREICLAAGMESYLSKPIQPRELMETIDAVINDEAGAQNSSNIEAEQSKAAGMTTDV
jgi:CheY-like chemotaxis protein